MVQNAYAVAIGIGKVGVLNELHGARNDAEEFATWAGKNGYAVTRLIDAGQKPVLFAEIRKAVDDILENDVDRLLIYFSGHGVGLAEGDYWLCSNFMDDGDECVSEALSTRTARDHRIGQLTIIADACRSTGAEAQRVNGRNLFKNPTAIFDVQPEVDLFYATRVGKVAQEKREGDPTKSYGVFSRCLFEALKGEADEAFDAARNPTQVTSQQLSAWLRKMVPYRSGLIPGAQVQRPSVIPGWWEPNDWYLERVAPPPAGPPYPRGPVAPPIAGFEAAFPVGASPGAQPERGQAERDAAERAAREEEVLHAATDRVHDQILGTEGRFGFETEQGLTVVGANVVSVASRPGSVAEKPDCFVEAGAWQIRCKRGPEPLAIELWDGRWIGTASLPGFVGAILVDEDSVPGLNFKVARNSPNWKDSVDGDAKQSGGDAAARWMALLTTGGTASTEEYLGFARTLRDSKHRNPSLGILAAYAYDRGRFGRDGQQFDSVDNIADHFAARNQFVPFDVALLMRDRKKIAAEVAGSFPFMTRGWSLLEAYPRPENELLLPLRPGLLPGPWTCLRGEEGKRLAALIETGSL